ncbi:MAG: hypothetical protein ACI8W8_000283 [Rhodothermales bacterium]|jgi:hypothetical protein
MTLAHAKSSIIAVSLLLTASFVFADTPTEAERLFTLKVLPVLSEKCFGCHDPAQEVKGGLNMSTREALLKGGEDFPHALVPGDSAKSFMMTAVKWEDKDYEMPPKENDRLSATQIDLLAKWIDAGAPWPDADRQAEIFLAERSREVTEDGVLLKTSGGLGDSWTFRRYKPEDVWAFQPLKARKPPADGNPVDAFVAAKLAKAGFEKAPAAGRRTLIRRVSYDLTGLPPTPEEITEFLAASEQNPQAAWTGLIDRLLASPHYGERWAQHWLDVARYADTAGLSNDYERSNTWRYRDYVIRALNGDKPYNRFIIEQIAGDELADQSLHARIPEWDAYQKARSEGAYNEEEAELLIASTFLRLGPWDPAMVKAPEARQQYIDDTVNAVGQTFLSTTMRCFKCHDHKFDPLPTGDYYRMYAAFAGTQLAERPAPFLARESKARFESEKAMVQRLHAYAKEKMDALNAKSKAAGKQWYIDHGKTPAPDNKKDVADEDKPPRHAGLNETEKGRLKVRKQDEWVWARRLERFEPLVQTVYNGPDSKGLNSRKMRMPKDPNINWRPDSKILTGGALEAAGAEVSPGVLSALGVPAPGAKDGDPYALTSDLIGRRLGLAKWIADARNPLTARSIVNRVWQFHFGKPIAGNPNNFGAKGEKPTHPELLDWLTDDFVKNGWRLKRLHRLILSSGTYQQAARHPQSATLANQDPDNDLFAYFPTRRLSAEELRDGMLRITGEFNPEMGGLPIRPEMNMEVALEPRMIQFSIAPTYLPSRTPQERNRRSIYAYRVRGLADPFLETFNQPNPNDSCELRDSASVSPQAFTLLNSDLVTDRSIAFALRLERETDTLGKQIDRAFQLALGRDAKAAEKQRMQAYVTEMRNYHRDKTPKKREYPSEVTRSLVEEFSGKPFVYQEILPTFEDYIADTQAADVSTETRALADFCLLLLNSNEFVYVY